MTLAKSNDDDTRREWERDEKCRGVHEPVKCTWRQFLSQTVSSPRSVPCRFPSWYFLPSSWRENSDQRERSERKCKNVTRTTGHVKPQNKKRKDRFVKFSKIHVISVRDLLSPSWYNCHFHFNSSLGTIAPSTFLTQYIILWVKIDLFHPLTYALSHPLSILLPGSGREGRGRKNIICILYFL